MSQLSGRSYQMICTLEALTATGISPTTSLWQLGQEAFRDVRVRGASSRVAAIRNTALQASQRKS